MFRKISFKDMGMGTNGWIDMAFDVQKKPLGMTRVTRVFIVTVSLLNADKQVLFKTVEELSSDFFFAINEVSALQSLGRCFIRGQRPAPEHFEWVLSVIHQTCNRLFVKWNASPLDTLVKLSGLGEGVVILTENRMVKHCFIPLDPKLYAAKRNEEPKVGSTLKLENPKVVSPELTVAESITIVKATLLSEPLPTIDSLLSDHSEHLNRFFTH